MALIWTFISIQFHYKSARHHIRKTWTIGCICHLVDFELLTLHIFATNNDLILCTYTPVDFELNVWQSNIWWRFWTKCMAIKYLIAIHLVQNRHQIFDCHTFSSKSTGVYVQRIRSLFVANIWRVSSSKSTKWQMQPIVQVFLIWCLADL